MASLEWLALLALVVCVLLAMPGGRRSGLWLVLALCCGLLMLLIGAR